MSTPEKPADNMPALLRDAALSAERTRKNIEQFLTGEKMRRGKSQRRLASLSTAWRDLAGQSEGLIVALGEAGIRNVPLASVEITALARAVASELWRLSSGPYPGSPLVLPCACSGQVNRPDMLQPLPDLVRDANGLVRGALP